jgi:hypothetical protein
MTLDPVDDLLDDRQADRPFLARLLQALEDRRPVERLAAAVLLDDERKHLLDAFVRGVAPLAPEALAPPPYHDPLTA